MLFKFCNRPDIRNLNHICDNIIRFWDLHNIHEIQTKEDSNYFQQTLMIWLLITYVVHWRPPMHPASCSTYTYTHRLSFICICIYIIISILGQSKFLFIFSSLWHLILSLNLGWSYPLGNQVLSTWQSYASWFFSRCLSLQVSFFLFIYLYYSLGQYIQLKLQIQNISTIYINIHFFICLIFSVLDK